MLSNLLPELPAADFEVDIGGLEQYDMQPAIEETHRCEQLRRSTLLL